tara:strand:+ start:895 stop:1113 length:219 start_codon:yes stop_codon:yes gene_type:complete
MKDFIINFFADRFGENSTITLLATAFIGGFTSGIATGDYATALIVASTNTAFALVPDKYINTIKNTLNKKAP